MYLRRYATWEETRDNFKWNVPEDLNIAKVVCDDWADREPERTALLDWNGGALTPYSYGWLATRSRKLANALRAQGVERGDRVALLLDQSPEVAAAHMAIYRLGCIALPLAMLFGPEAIDYRLKTSGASALITSDEGLEKITDIVGGLTNLKAVFSIDGARGTALDFHKVVADSSDQFERQETTAETPALMVFTSGTTGPPKGALHAHRVLAGLLPGATILHDFAPIGGDRYWTPADWAWAGGLMNILLPGLLCGIPVVCGGPKKFNPETAFEIMGRAKVTNTFIPPTALKIMKSVDSPRERFGVELRSIFSGGEALGKETFEWGKEALGLTINEGYGQTEANLVLVSSQALNTNKAGAMGKPTPGHEVAIIREDGSVCEPGETGQIAVKRPSPVMFLEYWGRTDATEDRFIGDWMTTGDQGLMDEEGFFHFFGRDDDVITSAGFRIGPGEIEDCLIGHPAVKLAAAVGKPDPIRTEIVKCYIVLEDGQVQSDEQKSDISNYVRTRLSAHEFPREIEFVSDMPLTTTGKVIRREFREMARNEAETAARDV